MAAAWRSPEQEHFQLDEWQQWLVRAVLERYPTDHPRYAGQLRYRQVLISMGRQNGKSVLGAVFGLYGLVMHTRGAEVVSVASTVQQSEIIYKRVKHVFDSSATLRSRFKMTGTRGITSRDTANPASYVMKAGAEQSLQGVTMSMCLYDEIHLVAPESWAAVQFGTSARRDGMVLGITTAGDSNSVLLKSLYETGAQAAAREEGYDERFGFFVWEAPSHLQVTDPDAIRAANPAIACGRLDITQEINALKRMPEQQARRYRLNQFVSAEATWLPQSLWNRLAKGKIPVGSRVFFSVDRATNWRYATITASANVDGKIYTEVVASLTNPSIDQLETVCMRLSESHRPVKFVMEASVLRDLAMRLRENGVDVEYLTEAQIKNACATAYSTISEQRVIHGDDALVNSQMNKGVAKNSGEGWRISRRDSIGDVDSLLAMVLSIYAAETIKVDGPMLMVFA